MRKECTRFLDHHTVKLISERQFVRQYFELYRIMNHNYFQVKLFLMKNLLDYGVSFKSFHDAVSQIDSY